MPLIDLKTDLKSLKYGQDKPGGGSSGQPFIVTDLDGSTSATVGPNNILRLVGLNRVPTIPNLSSQLNRSRIGQLTSQIIYDDTFIRGGILGSAQASLNDLFRIGAFLTTAPKGPLFIAKQVGLQLSNPRLETRKLNDGGGGGVLGGLIRFANNVSDKLGLGPTRIYNLGINTLAQVPANAFGIHFNRHGLQPIQNENTKYIKVVESNNENGNNRLVGYKNKLELGDVLEPLATRFEASRQFNLREQRQKNREINRDARENVKLANQQARNFNLLQAASAPTFISPITKNPIKFKRQKLDTTTLTIDSYLGGPDSVYGVGRTIIKRYDFTEDKGKIDLSLEQSNTYAGKSRTVDSSGAANPPSYAGALGINNDFQLKGDAIGSYDTTDTSLTDISKIDQNAIPLVGNTITRTYQTIKDKVDKTIQQLTQSIPFVDGGYNPTFGTKAAGSTISTADAKVNRGAADFKYYGPSNSSVSGSKKTYNNTDTFAREDSNLLSVIFRIITPSTTTPASTLGFSAYMTGYKDDFTGTWNETNYVGRAESFFIYSKFKRNVSFNLRIPCFNKAQLFERHRALGELASTTAGKYTQTGNGSVLNGVLLKVNVGNYLVGEYATLNSLGLSINDDSSWDISKDALLAMYLDVNVNLTIIHKNLPEYRPGGFFSYLPSPDDKLSQVPSTTEKLFTID